MNIIFKNKNLTNCSNNEIKELEIEHVSELLFLFEDARLCDTIGKQIVAEYGFKGTKKDVISQLLDYRNKLISDELSLDDISKLKERKHKLICFDRIENSMHNDIRQAIHKKDFCKIITLSNLIAKGNEILHNEHLCLCYNNI